jgi:hypothetical protein
MQAWNENRACLLHGVLQREELATVQTRNAREWLCEGVVDEKRIVERRGRSCEVWKGSVRLPPAGWRGSLLTYKDDGNFRSHCDGLMV